MSLWHKKDVTEVALEFGTDVRNGKTNLKQDRKRRGDNNVFLLPSVDAKASIKKLTSDASVALWQSFIFLYLLRDTFMNH